MGFKRQQYGFGLIELLVTLAVITMVISVGIPSFESFSKKSSAVARVDDINSAMRLARQVAIEHNFPAQVCTKSSTTLDNESCGNTTDWDKGLLVRVKSPDGSWQVIHNKSFAGANTSTSIYKDNTPTDKLSTVNFQPTGNLDTTTTGPKITINVTSGNCTAITKISITGRLKGDPLSNC
ncbi:MAG TPA: GspH/FimT family pseudopilin [Motiliproteus sp.]